MKLYRKIVHPYQSIDGHKYPIKEYKGRWFSEESKFQIMNDIYNTYSTGETQAKFFRNFGLSWETRYVEVSFTTEMDEKIEEFLTEEEQEL